MRGAQGADPHIEAGTGAQAGALEVSHTIGKESQDGRSTEPRARGVSQGCERPEQDGGGAREGHAGGAGGSNGGRTA